MVLTSVHLVDKPSELDFTSIREYLMYIIPLCLDSDPSLIPLSAGGTSENNDADGRDPDDFQFWSERQAKRICLVVRQSFEVEYAPEVILADANISALTNRILLSMEILTQ